METWELSPQKRSGILTDQRGKIQALQGGVRQACAGKETLAGLDPLPAAIQQGDGITADVQQALQWQR